MTPQEVVWFFNHKHGERAYLVETEQYLQIFTSKSKWKIIKDDYRRFRQYTLYHFSMRAGQGYHKQMISHPRIAIQKSEGRGRNDH